MIKNILLSGLFILALSQPARSDDSGDANKNSGVEHESSASFDKRLPPVLPGEEITKNGKTMKVWSSSGPVVVSEAPEPWKTPAQQLPSGIGVVVDQRNDHAEHK